MAYIVHLLRRRNMDMPISYIMVTLLIDNQLGTIIRKSQNFEELSDLISNQGLISRKLASFGPYFIMCSNLSSKEIYNKLNVHL